MARFMKSGEALRKIEDMIGELTEEYRDNRQLIEFRNNQVHNQEDWKRYRMAFESLSDKLQSAFKKLKGKGVLTEADISEAMRGLSWLSLEAGVNFKVVKGFCQRR